MDLDKNKLIAVAMKRLDVPGLVSDILMEVAKPALQEFVAKSDNPYDDMLVAALLPVLEVEAMKIVKEKWDELGADIAG